MVSTQIDPTKAERFAERMLQVLNDGALSLMASLGHRARLFDTMSELGPATTKEIASKTGLNERYVREWLGAMVAGGIVEVNADDADNQRYSLPPEHAESLTRAASSGNLAALSQYIGVLGSVEDEILQCFQHGGGVPYSAFKRFHEVMSEESGMTVVPALIDEILPLAPEVIEQLQAGIEVLDVGCGSGRALVLMAQNFPRSRFTGYDFSEEAIGRARKAAQDSGLSNLRFEVCDVATLNEVDRFHLITAFDAIHDQAAPRKVLANIARALKPDGTFLMQDIAASSHTHENANHPLGPLLYTVSCMHCMTVSLAQGGEGLGAMWGKQTASRLLRDAGFRSITVHQLPHDPQNYYYVNRLSL